MKLIVYVLVSLGLFGTLAASSFPIKGQEMYNSQAHNDLEQIVNEFIDQIDTESNFRREKKYQSDTQPLLDHGRKSDPTQPSCQSHMSLFESNRMIDTKTSVKNGAKFLGVDKIEPGDQFSLKELQDACVKMCCSTDFCDTGMLSLVHGQNGYRCYMFKCSQHCLFIKHKDYVLLRQKSPEQEFDEKNIQTGHKDNIKCHRDYEFTCLKIKQCIPVYDVCDSIAHCEDKTDELNCDSNSTSTTIRKKMTTKAMVDYYEDYEQDLIRQQDEILEHLRQLEARQHSDRFYHPKNFLENFMREEPSPRHKITARPSTRPSTDRVLFNDMGAESMKDMDVGWKENNERLVKFSDESKIRVSRSDSVQAVVILVVGCLLVVSFLVYIALSTKYLSKRLRIMNLMGTDRTKSSSQNVDADGDYLINGLYL